MAEAVADRVRAIIAEQLGVKLEEVTDAASFIEDLGADSLDTVELVMALEEEFGIEIPDEDAEKMSSVGDAIKYIESKPAGGKYPSAQPEFRERTSRRWRDVRVCEDDKAD